VTLRQLDPGRSDAPRIYSTTVARAFRQAAGAALLVAVLGGCAATSGIKPQSAELQPAAVQFDADAALDGTGFTRGAWPDARWWEMFGDPQLSRLIDEGLADSPGIRGAQARVRQANGYA